VQSHRGHGSVFVCPLTECGARLDADVNASIVLARRYYQRLHSEQPDSA
jgi:transposase